MIIDSDYEDEEKRALPKIEIKTFSDFQSQFLPQEMEYPADKPFFARLMDPPEALEEV